MAFDATGPESSSPSTATRRPTRRRAGKWGAGVVASVLLHVAPLLVMAGVWVTRAPVPVPPPEVVFDVELVRLQAPPRPPSEQPPGPPQVQAAASRPLPEPLQPRIPPQAPTTVEPLTLPPPPPPRVATAADARPAPETTAPPSRPAPPAANAAAAAQTWQGRLLAHLERRKRYPAEARSRRLQGVAHVRFTMDRQGRVLSVALERSSGHAVLDREAVALLRRAQPLPAPPAEVTGETLSLSVPVEFFVRSAD